MTEPTFGKDKFEEQLERFDRAWQGNLPPPVMDDFLPPSDSLGPAGFGRCEMLVELIMIDLEGRWRRQTPNVAPQFDVPRTRGEPNPDGLPEKPLLEDYLSQYPDLVSLSDLPIELVVQEYRVRHRWGDRPDHDSYLDRFPQLPDGRLRPCGKSIASYEATQLCLWPMVYLSWRTTNQTPRALAQLSAVLSSSSKSAKVASALCIWQNRKNQCVARWR